MAYIREKVCQHIDNGSHIQRAFLAIFLMVVLVVQVIFVDPAWAASWGEVVQTVAEQLKEAVQLYARGDVEAAIATVDRAYYGAYEEKGMEAAVRLNLSARQAAIEEYTFTEIKRLMRVGAPVEKVEDVRQELVELLRADAAALDQSSGNLSDFLSAFLIILREGLEAILILAALIAYLVKTGQGAHLLTVYQGALAALAASGLTAWVLQAVLRVSGAGQEILEGITMLVAVVVLFLVSFWLLDQAQARRWQAYIHSHVAASLSRGSRLALWWAAFLAVYREGAETVLFFQALLSGGAGIEQVSLGLILGLGLLAVVFVLIRWGSLKIPLRPFFAVTGFLLYYMAFVFAGRGVRELQEGGVVPATFLNGLPVLDWLGLYPTVETLVVQGLLVFLAFVALLVILRRRRGGRHESGG